LTVDEDDDDPASNPSTVPGQSTSARVYHNLANKRKSQAEPVSFVEFPIAYASSLERVLDAYPHWISIGSLHVPLDDDVADDDDEDNEDDDDEKESKAPSKPKNNNKSNLTAEQRETLREERAIEMITLLFNDGVLELSNDKSLPADGDIRERLKAAAAAESAAASAASKKPTGIAASVARLAAANATFASNHDGATDASPNDVNNDDDAEPVDETTE
jgi:hypothetical protein